MCLLEYTPSEAMESIAHDVFHVCYVTGRSQIRRHFRRHYFSPLSLTRVRLSRDVFFDAERKCIVITSVNPVTG